MSAAAAVSLDEKAMLRMALIIAVESKDATSMCFIVFCRKDCLSMVFPIRICCLYLMPSKDDLIFYFTLIFKSGGSLD
jgi:hypothetical protein